MAGITMAAPMPSMIDQPMKSISKPVARAVMSEPTAYTMTPMMKVRRRPMRSPRPAPASMSAAIVNVKVAIANCMELTVVLRSVTTAVMETFMTAPSITMTN